VYHTDVEYILFGSTAFDSIPFRRGGVTLLPVVSQHEHTGTIIYPLISSVNCKTDQIPYIATATPHYKIPAIVPADDVGSDL
jgi:hypothetical protein